MAKQYCGDPRAFFSMYSNDKPRKKEWTLAKPPLTEAERDYWQAKSEELAARKAQDTQGKA